MRLLKGLEALGRVAWACTTPCTLGVRVFRPSVRQVALHTSLRLQLLVLGDDMVAVGRIAQFATVTKEHGKRALFRGRSCAC